MRYIFIHLHIDGNGILIYTLFVMLGVDCQKFQPVLFSKDIEAIVFVSVPPLYVMLNIVDYVYMN